MYISVTEFIGRHLPVPESIESIDFKCAMCGQRHKEGKQNAIPITFTDRDRLKSSSETLCRYCLACIGKYNGTFFRNFSFLCTETNLSILKRDEIIAHLISPPGSLFVFGITFSGKKHISFKAQIQADRKNYTITTDIGNIHIDMEKFLEILPICQKWYSIIPEKKDTKQQPTWFTKDDILNGCSNLKRISDYGVNKYIAENNILSKHRNTGLLKVIVFAINKTN